MASEHRLSNSNLEAMTADCALCGEGIPLELDMGKARCKLARRETRRQYKQRNGQVNTVSAHALGGTSICPLCGPVTPVPWGNGFMCPNRAKELGWKVPDQPNPRCHRCEGFLTNRGICLDCTPVPLPKDLLDAGGSFHMGEMPLSRRIENAVPGWKTLGPPLDPGSPWAAYLT